MYGGARGTAGRLQLVRPKQVPRVSSETQQDGERDEPTATRDGIHKTGEDAGDEEQRELPGRMHKGARLIGLLGGRQIFAFCPGLA